MKEDELNLSEKFERDCLAVFEKLLQGYRKAKQSGIWESNMDGLVNKLTHLPTAPFPGELMRLFDYNYLVLSEDIKEIIDKAIAIREQMKHTKRFVKIYERYYSLPFLPKNTHLKRLEVSNHEGELCYLLEGKLRVRLKKLLRWLLPGRKKTQLQDVFTFKQKTTQFKNLEIYYYSPYVDLSSTSPEDYYTFFCDYYGKIQFNRYFSTKEILTLVPNQIFNQSPKALEEVLNLSRSQQVLWAYFLFRLMGLKLRVNVEVAIVTRFLHIVNRIKLDDYKNSYYYKLVSKAPYVKEDKNLLRDLETIRFHFQKSNLPTGDIEKEILNLVTK